MARRTPEARLQNRPRTPGQASLQRCAAECCWQLRTRRSSLVPGGFGRLDEMFEMLTWRQLGLGKKPCAFLDVNGFWQPLMAMLDSMVRERFLHAEQRNDLWHGDDIDILLAWMRDYVPAQADKWLDEKRRSQLKLTPEDV